MEHTGPAAPEGAGRLWADHVTHNPYCYALDMGEAEMDGVHRQRSLCPCGDGEKAKYGGGSRLDLNLHGDLPQLEPHKEEEKEEEVEEKVEEESSDDGGDDVTTSNRIPFQAKLVWRRFLALRSRHRYTNQISAASEDRRTSDKSSVGLWRNVTRRHLRLTLRPDSCAATRRPARPLWLTAK
ncbi:hypothetical protein NHX12_009023 [Muraenolepis orangiensis]|uniref:Uncharacterized protein n=1 Tax=Muraenolepis orangiensis TaxID=630683 RepID=A0A9Q0DNZ6_9TELE|nr:hypothetical protein NHX12_009023 [Muraenolepis orangiensis]